MGGDRADFFVSHAGSDRAWAEWVAWQLIDAGFSVELDVWDWAAGRNFVTAMSDALERCDKVVALFSAACFDRARYTTAEWSASVLRVPGLADERLIPLRVEEVRTADIPAVLRPLVFRDLFGLDAPGARAALLGAIKGPSRPDREPEFPGDDVPHRDVHGVLGRMGGSGPRLPWSTPRIWNVPARNPGFTGRDNLLVAVRERLVADRRAVVQALHGTGGVGKTQLAMEYAHRFAGAYDLAWWINAEQAGSITDQVAALGASLTCVPADAGPDLVRRLVLAELRGRGSWLLVFDNAVAPGDIADWLPGGDGHVLITSREHQWTEIAVPVEVDVLTRPESQALLRDRVAGLTDTDADRLAAALGDLPLALAQAASYLTETGVGATEYLRLLTSRAAKLMDQGRPMSYPRSLAAATILAFDQLAKRDPAAAELANLCAFLAPEPIPSDLLTEAAPELPPLLAERAADPLTWHQTFGHLSSQSLARVDQRGIQFHRLTQAILRDCLSPTQATTTRARAEAILAASHPGDFQDPTIWPRWAMLMPHLLAVHPQTTTSARLRNLAEHACWYLIARGDASGGHDLAASLHQHRREDAGDDDPDTLRTVHTLSWALWNLGRYAEARDLSKDTLERLRRTLGPDHNNTLASATSLAVSLRALGDAQAARDLDQDTLNRRRRALGPDHPETLISASNLAICLRELGNLQAARDLHQDTLDRYRRSLGPDHPDTLASANNLASDLHAIGDFQAARDLDQDTLDRRRSSLGPDHPDTLDSTRNLARDVAMLEQADGGT
ncbi:MAG TPA: FxSxx-COOH system tetratricopeptide repeat protein [Streptosporangiaceae bacterium]|nr:FxSxx-COOH system tetratricopeptide repeat protein [Streptosporangiaceae bacterium]